MRDKIRQNKSIHFSSYSLASDWSKYWLRFSNGLLPHFRFLRAISNCSACFCIFIGRPVVLVGIIFGFLFLTLAEWAATASRPTSAFRATIASGALKIWLFVVFRARLDLEFGAAGTLGLALTWRATPTLLIALASAIGQELRAASAVYAACAFIVAAAFAFPASAALFTVSQTATALTAWPTNATRATATIVYTGWAVVGLLYLPSSLLVLAASALIAAEAHFPARATVQTICTVR